MPRTARRTALRTAAATVCLALVPLLSGCSIGVNAGTSTQKPSGNGSNADSATGTIALRAITLVTGDGAATYGTVIGTIVNSGPEPDALVSATVTSPTGATTTIAGSGVVGGVVPLPAQRNGVRIGYAGDRHIDVTGLTIAPTAFARIDFHFQVAGTVSMQVMAVPPSGIYQGLGPLQH